MNRNKLALFTLLVLLVTLKLHLLGMYDHLYLKFWYYDIIVHILGGIGIALSTLYILKNPKYIFISTIICGILWELFEAYFGISGSPVGSSAYIIDTTKDLIDDMLGALIVWFAYKNKK